MEPKPLERKLTAILYADVAGYSRLTGEDEEGTHRALSAYLDAITASIEKYNGTVLHFAGDAVLADFATVSDALICAAAVQQDLKERNKDLPDDRKVQFRIGVNLGEVIVDRNEIYGDGVNVAARLESLAEPGGICISDSVHTAVGNKLPLEYEFIGEQEVKNIAKPVRAYAAKLKPGAVLPAPSARPKAQRPMHHVMAATAAAAVLVIGAGLIAWWQPWQTREEPASLERMAFPLPDKPSIAVLPFDNLSGDPEQEYFSDGMTDDLITDLSKISGLFVIARNSTFAYKGKPVKVRQVAEELGVRYVLEGSVRKVKDRVRINAQLIDAQTGGHVWAERFDRDYKDVFALQDEVIGKIVAALAIELTDAEQTLLSRRRTDNLEAYDYYLRAERRRHGWSDRVGRSREVLSLYERAIALDPMFADAYVGLAMMAAHVWRHGGGALPGPMARKRAYEAASKALSLDPRSSRAYSVLAILQATDSQHEQAIASAQKAVTLNPNDAEAYVWLSRVLIYAGKHAEALSAVETAFRFNPKPPPYLYAELGSALFWNRQYEKAIEPLEKARSAGVRYFNTLAMTYAQLGRVDEARAVVDEIRKRVPFVNLNYYRVLSNLKRKEDLEHRIALLRRAGVPEWPFGYEGRLEDRLVEQTIKAITFGRTWIGQNLDDVPFVQETTREGNVAIRTPGALRTGTAWVEGGMLCYDLSTGFASRTSCGYLFRNPTGTPEQKNEYVQVVVAGVSFFSVQP